MNAKVKKAVKESVIKWIQALDDEKILFNLYEFKEHHGQITTEEKEEYNRWLSELDYKPQLEMLRSIIASSPDRNAILSELSLAAQENIRVDEGVEANDLKHTPDQFWGLVSDLKLGEELNKEGLSEGEKEALERADEDIKAGRTIPHEEVMKEVNQWLNEMKVKRIKEYILDMPVDIRSEIVDYVLETLNRSK